MPRFTVAYTETITHYAVVEAPNREWVEYYLAGQLGNEEFSRTLDDAEYSQTVLDRSISVSDEPTWVILDDGTLTWTR